MNHEASERLLVAAAMQDILAGRFDSDAVREVMQRRAGTMDDYRHISEQRDLAERVSRAST